MSMMAENDFNPDRQLIERYRIEYHRIFSKDSEIDGYKQFKSEIYYLGL
jgi:hypothetical protein